MERERIRRDGLAQLPPNTPESIRTFCERIGVAKRENTVDVALLEHAVREDLNKRAPRVMGVLNPLHIAKALALHDEYKVRKKVAARAVPPQARRKR